jgi:hypothetical protein
MRIVDWYDGFPLATAPQIVLFIWLHHGNIALYYIISFCGNINAGRPDKHSNYIHSLLDI